MNRYILVMISMAVSLLTAQSHAAAVACRTTMTDMDFGVVDFVNSALSKTNTGTLTYHCVNNSPAVQHINACFYLGDAPPSPAATAAWSTMHNDVGAAMLFRLKNAVTGEIWGTRSSQLPVRVTRSLPGNSEVSGNISIKGELFSNQRSLTAGSYRSRFNTDSAIITWSESTNTTPNTCLEQTVLQPLEFMASAIIQKSCRISTQDIDFGQTAIMDGSNIEAQGEITVECTNDTQYRIALRSVNMKNGQFYLYPITGRGMDKEKIAYSLYQNPARTLLWADSRHEKAEQGIGGRQAHPVYGQVPRGQATSFRSGNYQDTVVVTLSF
ncbi:MAG: spore coat U domain-containing protein [Chania sp.]